MELDHVELDPVDIDSVDFGSCGVTVDSAVFSSPVELDPMS